MKLRIGLPSRLTLLCLSLLLPQLAQSENLVVNGGFESGTFAGWTVVSPGGVPAASITTNDPHSGLFSAIFNPVDHFTFLSQEVPTEQGHLYTMTHWVMIHDLPPLEYQVFWNGQMVL